MSSSPILLCALVFLPCLLQQATAYTVRTEIAYRLTSRIDSAVPTTDSSSTSLYLSAFATYNSTIFYYDRSTKALLPVVQSTTAGGCVPNFNDPPFHESFPIVPTSISYIASQNRLLLADRTPSNRIFEVTAEPGVLLSANTSANKYGTLVGGPCNYAESSFEETDEGVPSNTSMTMPSSMAFDAATGNVYFSLKYSVAVVYPNGTMNYFFGSDRRRGNREDTWNLQEQDRRNATTRYPLQLSIDPVLRILYVVEQGFTTIRAVSLVNDTAKIVLGQLEGSYTWPPLNCYPEACKAADFALIYPTAVAFYRPRSVNERWLFVGDRTLAQVFKFVLDTGMVYSVGGQSLMTGSVDGPASLSQFRSITSFATSDSTLYISDGGLRVMDLNDRTTPPPPIVPEEVVDGTKTTIMISTVVALNPMGIVQVARANVILELLRCQRVFGYLDPMNHLLQFGIGEDEDFRYFAGAVVGNIGLAIGFVLLHAFLAWVIATAWATPFGTATASLRFPSLVAFPLMFVMESTMASSVSLALYADGYYQALGIIGIVSCVVITIGIAIYFAFVFQGARSDEFELARRYSGLLARFLRPVGEWVATDNNRRMGMFFNDYLPNRWWFAVIELIMCIATGIAEGIKPIVFEQCLSLIIYATVLYTLFFGALLILQPNTVRFKFMTGVVIAGLQGVACYMLIATIANNDRGWEATSTSLVLASLYIGLPRTLFELGELVYDIYRLIKDQKPHQAQQLTRVGMMVRSDSSSGSSSNSSIVMTEIILNDDDAMGKRQESGGNSFAGSFQFPRSPNQSMAPGELAHERVRKELRVYMDNGVDGKNNNNRSPVPPPPAKELKVPPPPLPPAARRLSPRDNSPMQSPLSNNTPRSHRSNNDRRHHSSSESFSETDL